MARTKEELLAKLSECVVEMEEEEAAAVASNTSTPVTPHLMESWKALWMA